MSTPRIAWKWTKAARGALSALPCLPLVIADEEFAAEKARVLRT